MKKILIFGFFIVNLLADQYYIYHAKEIGEIKFPGMFNTNLTIYCIDGVQYAKDCGPQVGFMTVLFDKNGKPKTCK